MSSCVIEFVFGNDWSKYPHENYWKWEKSAFLVLIKHHTLRNENMTQIKHNIDQNCEDFATGKSSFMNSSAIVQPLVAYTSLSARTQDYRLLHQRIPQYFFAPPP